MNVDSTLGRRDTDPRMQILIANARLNEKWNSKSSNFTKTYYSLETSTL